jgi:hypothetical protein
MKPTSGNQGVGGMQLRDWSESLGSQTALAVGSIIVLVAGCALPDIHREDAVGKQPDAGVAQRSDAAVSVTSIVSDADAGEYDPLMDPANRNEDYATFMSLVPKEHVFAEWLMPDTTEHAKAKPSYTVSEHVITDNVTQLRWQRVLPVIYPGCTAEYKFVERKRGVGTGCTWEEAQAYCQRPEVAAELGPGDWRVPTKIELESLVDVSRVNSVDPLFDDFPIDLVWTSSPFPNPKPNGLKLAWAIDFMVGSSFDSARFSGARVRCVASRNREGGSALEYEELGDNKYAIRDKHTQLEWQRFPDSATRNWAEAKAYCEGLELNGVSWRLPSFKELLTIVDSTRNQPSVTVRALPVAHEERYWSSSEFLDGRDSVYQVSFKDGVGFAGSITDEHYVRCVR